MKPGINWVANDTIYFMPNFIHEFGDDAHHWSMTRTCDFDEDGGPIPGTGPSDLRYFLHDFLDLWVFYPIQHWMRKWIGDNAVYNILRLILGIFWGLNCGFPFRDVTLYTVWDYRGCAPRAVFKKKKGEWIQTYPPGKKATQKAKTHETTPYTSKHP